MKERLVELAGRFDGLQQRERWLVFMAAAVLLFLLVDSLVFTPLGKTVQQKQAELSNAQTELATTVEQLNALQTIFNNDPLSIKLRERDALQQQIAGMEDELSELAGGLVKAEALPLILEEILVKAGNLKLQTMVTAPAERQMAGVYKHRVTVKLTGGFVEVLNYLKALEQLPWRFYWEALHYDVKQYPDAEVEVQVYTLSTSEGVFNA